MSPDATLRPYVGLGKASEAAAILTEHDRSHGNEEEDIRVTLEVFEGHLQFLQSGGGVISSSNEASSTSSPSSSSDQKFLIVRQFLRHFGSADVLSHTGIQVTRSPGDKRSLATTGWKYTGRGGRTRPLSVGGLGALGSYGGGFALQVANYLVILLRPRSSVCFSF